MSLMVFQHNTVLAQAVIEALADFQTNFRQFSFDQTLLQPVEKFAVSGKLFRGGLCLSVVEAIRDEKKLAAIDFSAAVALELTGSAILIQDDVMDEAILRRDLPALHQQYAQVLAPNLSSKFKARFGESAAICVSDVLLFLATKVLSSATGSADLRLSLITAMSQELTTLALNQAEELRFAALPPDHPDVSEAHILQIMVGKTAKYTVEWPLKFAGILAEANQQTEKALAEYGQATGIVFQLSDDRLGLFGDIAKTGKDVDSDAKTGKKTLYAFYAREMLSGAQAKRFHQLYGKADLSLSELAELQNLLKDSGVVAKVDQKTGYYVVKAKQAIEELSNWPKLQALLMETVEFLANRER